MKFYSGNFKSQDQITKNSEQVVERVAILFVGGVAGGKSEYLSPAETVQEMLEKPGVRELHHSLTHMGTQMDVEGLKLPLSTVIDLQETNVSLILFAFPLKH